MSDEQDETRQLTEDEIECIKFDAELIADGDFDGFDGMEELAKNPEYIASLFKSCAQAIQQLEDQLYHARERIKRYEQALRDIEYAARMALPDETSLPESHVDTRAPR